MTFANVTSLVALFVALGGVGYAAATINGGLIKNRTISASKLKKHTLTGTEINLAKLGTVPKATTARNAVNAVSAGNAVNAANATNLGGTAASAYEKKSELAAALTAAAKPVPFTDATLQNSWLKVTGHSTPGFSQDQFGVVHLRGAVMGGATTTVFTLPAAVRPTATKQFATSCGPSPGAFGSITVNTDGTVVGGGGATCTAFTSLEGITFRTDG
jgi:hypothetical protein